MALPDVRSALLTVGATQGPAAVATPVDQAWQSLVAGETEGPGVVIRSHGPRTITEYHLPRLDITRSDQQPPAALLLQHGVVHGQTGEERRD